MAKYKVQISRVEYYINEVVVEAETTEDAIKKVDEKWQKDEELYEETTDILHDAETHFTSNGLAKENEIEYLTYIE